MGAQKKGGAAAKQKSKFQKSPAPPKAFEVDDFEDDDDEDFDGSDSGSEGSGYEMAGNKKTPNKGGLTPAQTRSGKKKDMHVSFQLQGKNTPSNAQKTPRGNELKGTPMPGKRTPGGKQDAILSGRKGKSSLKEFAGTNNLFGAKIETLSPPQKGKIHPAAKGSLVMKSKPGDSASKKRKAKDEDSDDDDDDFDDEMDDDDDMGDSDDDMNEEDDDEDDLDDEEEDDDDEDEELDSEEERKLCAEILAIKGGKKGLKALEANRKATPAKKTPQKAQKETEKPNAQSPKKAGQTPSKSALKGQTPAKSALKGQTPKAEPKKLESPAKSNNVQKSSEGDSGASQADLTLEQKRRKERDSRHLFIRGIPADLPIDDLKALSPDILDVTMPKVKYQKKNMKKVHSYFAFLEFASEAKAEENYTLLQGKKIRGSPVFIDFTGEKSKNRSVSGQKETVTYNKKKLFISGLTTDIKIDEIAKHFRNANFIMLNTAPEFRNCTVCYNNEEDAAEAFTANANLKLNGRLVTVLHCTEGVSKKNRKAKKRQNKSNQPQAKKMKVEHKTEKIVNEDDEDDDDDDDDDEDDE